MSKPLRLLPYQPRWKAEFIRLQDHLANILEGYFLKIHHVGSTSVETLHAKPIIDIDIEHDGTLDEISYILEMNNYEYEGEKGIPGRFAFRYLLDDFHEHHLYVIEQGEAELAKHLQFKRALQMNKRHRDAYTALKKQLIAENELDRERYTIYKTTLIQSIMKEEMTMKSIVFAGGCFWGVEAYFKQLEGVKSTEVGYVNGNGETTYEQVCQGSGHAEAVLIHFDEEIISFKKLLDHLFNIIDPTSINKQGPDIGVQYRSGIYNYTPDQLPFINNYLTVRQKEYTRPLAIELATDLVFFPAEENHQDYLDKNKNGYCHVDLSSYQNIK